MCRPRSERRLIAALLLALSLAAAVVLLALGSLIYQFRAAADFPGAARVSDHTLYKFVPRVVVRRDTSYRTTAPFTKVYNWYSSGFSLGPEKRAQSGCILMENSTRWIMVVSNMSVMLCDTPAGRMVFVMRALALRWPQ